MRDDTYYYCRILGVPKDYTLEEIKKSYKRLCKLYHPDRGGDGKMFVEINNAYTYLKNKREGNQHTRERNAYIESRIIQNILILLQLILSILVYR